jgi:hypothetical protein
MLDCEVIRYLDADYRDKSFEYPERRITAGYNEGLVRTVTDKALRGRRSPSGDQPATKSYGRLRVTATAE